MAASKAFFDRPLDGRPEVIHALDRRPGRRTRVLHGRDGRVEARW
jgi:hypothetical protein